jgi:5-methylcytosine-specific restriction endonuclease McrA
MTNREKTDTNFIITTSPETVRKEKEKARALRKTQWWQRQVAKGKCFYCHSDVNPKELTMDHIVPLIRGGRSTRGNVAPACKQCNDRKKYLLPIEWEGYLDSLQKFLPNSNCQATASEKESEDE